MTSGSADVINVNFAALAAGSEALSARAGQLTQNIDQLTTGIQPLKTTWTQSGSSAGEAYDAAEAKLKAAINDIINTINQFSSAVAEAQSQQQQLEKTNTGYFGA